MLKFLLWLLLLAVCWPLALLALVLWPVVAGDSAISGSWGLRCRGALEFLRALFMFAGARARWRASTLPCRASRCGRRSQAGAVVGPPPRGFSTTPNRVTSDQVAALDSPLGRGAGHRGHRRAAVGAPRGRSVGRGCP